MEFRVLRAYVATFTELQTHAGMIIPNCIYGTRSWDALAQRRWSQIPLNLAKPQPTQALRTKRHQTRLTRQGSGDCALVEAPLFMKAGFQALRFIVSDLG